MSKDNLKVTIKFPSLGKEVKTDTNTIEEIAKALTPPKRNKSYAYKMGLDCVRNGENLKNCHFSIFSSKENMREWERGKRDGKKSQNNRVA